MNKLFTEISSLTTEQNNPRSSEIDQFSVKEILELINSEDSLVAPAVLAEMDHIADAVEEIVKSFRAGGRLIYVGAGTSGRLGVVDASECPPTFGTDPDMVQAVIAGGNSAVFQAVEGAEDNPENGRKALQEISLDQRDVVCGIAASGRTPFVVGALQYAREIDCHTILVSTNSRTGLSALGIEAKTIIAPKVGPEVVSGSTRMKSGTAQKLVLNMLSTASMIRLGKTYGNVMVDLQVKNAKLGERAKRILMELANVDYALAEKTLQVSEGKVKTALVMLLAQCSREEAERRLHECQGFIRQALL